MAVIDERRVELRATAAIWAANDITPLAGELSIETDDAANHRIKVGDGSLAYSALNYASRRTDAELTTDLDAYVVSNATDLSAGVADSGKLVLLDGTGIIDSSMLPSGTAVEFTSLGEADFTAIAPAAPGGSYTTGQVYWGSTTGQFHPTWGFPDDALGNQPGCEIGDLLWYDLAKTGGASWRFIPGEQRTLYLIDRNHASDAAAAEAGVPIGSTYRNGGAVQIRVL